MRYLIVVADDLGLCEQRDAGIFECLSNGSVSSACIFANGPTAERAFATCLENGYDLGLHLNLTVGMSLTSGPSIADSAGLFLGKSVLRDKISRHAVAQEDVAAEIRAQLRWFCDHNGGNPPAWVNGHNHVHVYPVIAKVFAREMQKFGIRGTRMCIQDSPRASALAASSERTSFHTQVAAEARDAQRHFIDHGLIWPPAFIGFNLFGCADVDAMVCEINSAFSASQVVELMCHVGRKGQHNTGFGLDDDAFNASADRENEMKCISSRQLCSLTSSSIVPFSKMLAVISATARPSSSTAQT